MTTLALGARPRSRTIERAVTADLRVAGSVLFAAGAIILMGIITAEALYPAAYTTHGNEISDLGGTRPTAGGVVLQPSATIFNLTMILTGLLVTAGAVLAHRSLRRPTVSGPIVVLGLAVLGVGIFPGNTGTPHAILAMVAFISGGVAAVLSARVVDSPVRYLFAALGAINLGMLASYFALGDANPFWVLGVGGAERWVAYPVILWLLGFGGCLAGRVEAPAGPPR